VSAATGFAVAGGRSLRIGQDKALLAWGATTLLDHALDRLRPICADVRILSGPARRYEDRDVPVHPDVRDDAGSLGGVYTGLLALELSFGLFLGVDLPLVPVALLRRLLELAPGHDAVVPVSRAGPEPLCAVYAKTCRRPIERRMESGDFKMTSFWPDVRVREVGLEELVVFGEPSQLFLNVNTPEEYERALRERVP
jgi:molybdopterin-guanine dinucleotide biosynthesis protein A